MALDRTAPGIDDLLLRIVAAIELSDRDRRVAEKRYRQLKNHLERAESPLAPYLGEDVSLIHAQGSRAIGATIVSGTDDDRFDLDAVVEFPVPPLDAGARARHALRGAPGVPGRQEYQAMHTLRSDPIRFHAS